MKSKEEKGIQHTHPWLESLAKISPLQLDSSVFYYWYLWGNSGDYGITDVERHHRQLRTEVLDGFLRYSVAVQSESVKAYVITCWDDYKLHKDFQK